MGNVNLPDNSGGVLSVKWPDMNFEISPADPCLSHRKDELGICMIIIYVDDMLVVGHKKSIQDLQNRVEKSFSIKIEKKLADYLGCEFHMNQNKTKGWLGQPSIIKSIEKEFGVEAMKHRLGLTPGTPRFVVMRVAEDGDKLPAIKHVIYCSGVGTSLYLTKHSRRDICNAVRELSKPINKPAPVHLKEISGLSDMCSHQRIMG